ncbi:MAG: nucleotidyltransferase domain-containing protein, partial [bacterium]
IRRFVSALKEQGIRECRVILFGSHARGNAGVDSDIDLVVVSDDFEGKDFWERTDILTEAIFQVYEPLEVIAVTNREWEKGDFFINECLRTDKYEEIAL